MLAGPIVGPPGVSNTYQANYRRVFYGPIPDIYLPGGKTIDGTKARDPDNGVITNLRAGLLLGKITATGFYANTVLGVTTGAYTSGGTTLTVSAAQATEIARRVGTSGTATLKAIGPPTAAGTVATTNITFSAVNTTSGDITVTSLGVDKIAGTLIVAADGSETPITFIPDGFPFQVVEPIGGTGVYAQQAKLPIAGIVQFSQLLPAVTDTSLITFIKNSLSTTAGGKFSFSDTW